MLKTCSSIVFPLITFPYISRTLQAENVGKINFGSSIISYFSLIATLGITTHAIRECSAVREDKDKLGKTASQIYSINILTTLAAYILLAVLLATYRKLDPYRYLIILQSLSIACTTIGADWINSSMEDFQYITIRAIVFQLISLILMFIFVHRPEDYMRYAVISLISSSGVCLTNIIYRRKFCKIRFTLNIDWRRHIEPIVFLFVMILAQNIFNNIDSTMLGLMHGDRAVGIYSVAHKLSGIVFQIVASLLWVVIPRLSLYYADADTEKLNSLLRKILGFNLTIGLPCVTGAIVLSQDIILVISGPSYIEATPVLQILMIGLAFRFCGEAFLGNAILLPMKEEKTYMSICVVAAIINICTNYLLIPRFGVFAAAGTTAFCSFFIFLLLWKKVHHIIRINNTLKLIVPPFLGCLSIVFICKIFSIINNLWVRTATSIVMSAVAYGIVQIIFRNELTADFWRWIKRKAK